MLRPIVPIGVLDPAHADIAVELFLTRPNVELIRRLKLPPLYSSGIRYFREKRRHEVWQPANLLFRKKRGDCEDLSAYLAAEYRIAGRSARVRIRPNRGGGWHAIVIVDDREEDPSARLGM